MGESRQQQMDFNARRLRDVAAQLSEIGLAKAKTTDAGEQAALLQRERVLRDEESALTAANAALTAELAEAKEQERLTSERIWMTEERPAAERELEELAEVVVTRLENAGKAWRALREAEARHREVWIKRGRPGDVAFQSRAGRSFAGFLGVGPALPSNRFPDRARRLIALLRPNAWEPKRVRDDLDGVPGLDRPQAAERL